MELEKYISNNTLSIIVKPNATKTRIIGFDENRNAMKVEVKPPSEENKANIEIVKYFRRLTGKNVNIISGLKSKRKLIRFST